MSSNGLHHNCCTIPSSGHDASAHEAARSQPRPGNGAGEPAVVFVAKPRRGAVGGPFQLPEFALANRAPSVQPCPIELEPLASRASPADVSAAHASGPAPVGTRCGSAVGFGLGRG